ncbi:MAG TPA: hypothetical protein VK564_01905, partial [Thermodesulfobacteriota bacterium]|nr:hypothetical protein [Thermodesulfobacteriota bacterium]
TVLLLDMLHYLDDQEFEKTLERVKELMTPTGKVILRATILEGTLFSWVTLWELKRLKLFRIPAYFRSIEKIKQTLNQAGFTVLGVEPTPGRREYWIAALAGTDEA